jgi:hypothetical protein
MQNEEFYKIASILRAAYPRQAIPNKETYDLWLECLQDLDTKWVENAGKDLIKTSRYCPSIAEVREKYESYDRRTEQDKYIEAQHLQR